jgi:deoxycytidine triphosphate deaminase
VATTPSGIETGVLPHQEILRLCGLLGNELPETEEEGAPLQPCLRKNVRSASYDLRLGREYYFSERGPQGASGAPSMEVSRLEPGRNEHIVIEPNQVVVVSSLEKLCLPKDTVGHLTVKQDILLQGLIMGSQSQVDAGYRGWIYPLFYNLTSSPVTLQLEQSIIRLELVRLPSPTTRPYEGDYQERTLSQSLKAPIGSSLTKLWEKVEQRGEEIDAERKRLSKTQLWGTIGGAVGAIAVLLIPIVLAYATGLVDKVNDTKTDIGRLEGKFEGPGEPNQRLEALEAEISRLSCELREKEKPSKPANC